MYYKDYAHYNLCYSYFLDGPTIIQILLDKFSKSTRVSIKSLKEELCSIKAYYHGSNVLEMLFAIEIRYFEIAEEGRTYPDKNCIN